MKLQGVFVPLVTPFLNDKVDFVSYQKMIDYYINKGISGLVPLGTTGESPTISEYEYEEIIVNTMQYNNNRVPVYVGIGGNNTYKVIKQVALAEKYKLNGILSVCPYYNRPSQEGIYQHFLKVSESTDSNIIVYNIPYRTGKNIENETIYKLAELKNIVALKDSCGDIKQTTQLLLSPPKDFSILTGEDALFYTTLNLGGDGGILASSHMKTEVFIQVFNAIKDNNHQLALKKWKSIANFIPLLFGEPNPAPIKYCLNKMGVIESSEVRLPLTEISNELKSKLEQTII
ncbi:4-hydroxy-tetrahydrodipicolinate synthase [Clostridium sp. 'deep sea']|uniref:4-hydroxy-tetrahydrodipicolinate synthase n=1 Tax=Clostridium sp. 'deep sea' TaxID=2779445 RepID=UPI001896713E|nr:4-hydroxy-tetrahydrodipicolinate synthase [Clostridium sp. 'deep sea']QOR35998.1 4-hydroxy-tetrahydrodipicolinate synthase [Clostridium sp. 'deep sea']